MGGIDDSGLCPTPSTAYNQYEMPLNRKLIF